MRYNRKSILKIKSGQTVWRCLIWPTRSGATVSIDMIHVLGKKTKSDSGLGLSPRMNVLRKKRRPSDPPTKYFLNDIVTCDAFSTYRQAKRFEQEVMCGMHDDKVRERREDLDEMDRIFGRRSYLS